MKKSVYEIVTNRIIQLLEKGTPPWRKSWTASTAERPMNYRSKSPYKGINFFLLSACFDDPYFLTFKQAKEMGGNVKKGEKAIPVIFWNWLFFDKDGKRIKDEKQAAKKLPLLRYYNVFNASQIEGIEFEYPEHEPLKANQKIQRCEAVVKSCKNLNLKFKNRASYHPIYDVVNMPEIGCFENSFEYYGTLFHELGHWTGHASRLDRFKKENYLPKFGNEDYSKEELIAEMTAAFLCHHCQIDTPEIQTNQAAYLQSWIKVLKGDSKLIINAAAQAEKAQNYILYNNENSN